MCFLFFIFVFGSGCLFSAVGGAGDAVLVLLGVVVVVVTVVPALPVVEEGRQDLWEVGAASVVLRGVGSPASLIFGEDGPDAVPVASLGCGWEGKCGCSDVGTVRGGNADGLALGSNLHHRVEGGVALLCGVEGEWGLHASPGAVHEELLEATLANDLEVQGGRGGRGGRGRSGCDGGGHLCCGLFRGECVLSVCAFVEFECGINWMIAWFLEINFDPRLVTGN